MVSRKGRVPEKYSVSMTNNNLMFYIQEKATRLSKTTGQFWMLFLATQIKGSFSQDWPDMGISHIPAFGLDSRNLS